MMIVKNHLGRDLYRTRKGADNEAGRYDDLLPETYTEVVPVEGGFIVLACTTVSDEDAERAQRHGRPYAVVPVVADKHGNVVAQEGCTRCECGCKYWENDRCVDCGSAPMSVCA